MTITTTQLSTRVRTWALVAGLTALIVALGALVGGVFLWLFAALAVAMNIVGYFYSDRVALRVARAQPLRQADAPEVYESVRQLALRAAIPMPRLFVMPGEQPNAFATGRNPRHAAVAVTEGLLLSLSHRQVRGVLAHELSHIKNRDILVSSIAATMAGAIAAIANIMQLSFLFGADEEDNPLGGLGALAAMIVAPLGAMLLQLGVSRQREYLADVTAARLLGGAAPLADALQEIERAHAPALAVSRVTAPMYIVNPLAGRQLTAFLSTHPPLSERIRRLRAYDRATGTRQQPAHTPVARAA
ncbi:MAG TPA: M48 family metalloprotease [Solirubrobacteraceae bacterium]|nr:M48 family metalloprotease [Solirubrobacteraceae bacterium]